MSGRRRASYGSKTRSFIGYTGLEVVSDEGSSSYSNQVINGSAGAQSEGLAQRRMVMDDVPSYHSLSISDMQVSSDDSTVSYQNSLNCHCNKSTVSTLLSFLIMITGIILVPLLKDETTPTRHVRIVCQVIRAAGLFGFTGGVTNWIAIKLIFTRISHLFCSGAIFKHFVAAREIVAEFIMEAFFSPAQVKKYMQDKINYLLDAENFDQNFLNLLNSETIAKLVNKKLDLLMATPEGVMLHSLGVTKSRLRPVVMRYITDIRSCISPLLIASLQSSELTDTQKIREQVIDMIATRTQQISPQRVQQIICEALYKHLSWLVLWGNLFGAIVGCVIEIASIYTRGLSH